MCLVAFSAQLRCVETLNNAEHFLHLAVSQLVPAPSRPAGSWNERAYDTDYLKLLRTTLDGAGFTNTKIIAPDAGW